MANSNEYMRLYMLARYHERRKEALALLGNKCAKCGSRKRLEIDHIDRKTKSFSVSRLWSISRALFDLEISKCQLLCKSCHTEKSILESGKKIAKGDHGTVSTYRYCKCIKCRAAWNKAARDYKRRVRALVG